MKLLILTQKVDINDDVLGFFHGWIAEFAKKCEKITVICLKKGEYSLPENVKILSLGKEDKNFQFSIFNFQFRRINYLLKFYKFIWQERNNYDVVLVHMNPEYVLLGGCFWRLWKKKIGLWYTHKKVDLKLRLAEKIVNIIFTASRESFRLSSNKLKVLGHGIDVKNFQFSPVKPGQAIFPGQAGTSNFQKNSKILRIISIGRISPVKDYETLISAAEILKRENFAFKIKIIGGPAVKGDEKYFKELKDSVSNRGLGGLIEFTGPVPNINIEKYFQSADLFINLSHTGSLDKAILEAMASGLPAITCNDAAISLFKEYSSELIFKKKNPVDLAAKILDFNKLTADRKKEIAGNLKNIVEHEHNLENLINKILDLLK